MIVPLLAGAAAFGVLLICDYAESRAIPVLKLAGMAAGAGLLLYAMVACMLDPWKAHLPIPVRTVSGVLAAGFLVLLVTSLFLEIPPRKGLVTTGTYALVRHPGVLWFPFFLLSTAAAADSLLLLVATPLWTGMDLLYAAVQDRLFFPRLFGDAYRAYRRVTPFIIPNVRSMRLFFETWRVPFRQLTTKNGGHYGNGE